MLSTPRRGAVAAAVLALATSGALAGCAQRGDLLGFVPAPDGSSPDDGGSRFGPPHYPPPTLVGSLSDPADDEDPSFTGDVLELYFSSTRAGTADIWVSRRTSRTDLWGPPARVSELSSSTSVDRSPSVSLDGLAMWFATDRDTARGQIWRSSRPSRYDTFGAPVPWGTPAPVVELASPYFDSAPSVDPSETMMFFTSFRSSTPSSDIFYSTRPSVAASWAPPLRVPGLDTTVDEADPFVAQGGLLVFFSLTTRGGLNSDLYWSARHSTEAPFPPPLPVEGVNSAFADSDPSLSLDLFYMMFSSSRSGNFEIYETQVPSN